MEGVFLEEGTEEEYEDYDKKENKGWGNFIKDIFNLDNKNETNN